MKRSVLLLSITGVTVLTFHLFIATPRWMPPGASGWAPAMDSQFGIAFVVLGLMFITGQFLLALTVFRAGEPAPAEPARFPHGNWRFEIAWTVAITVIFFSLGLAGNKLWSQIKLHSPEPGALNVEVTGAQFQWYFRYPGPDGRLGRLDAQRFARPDEGNPLGIDPSDPAGRDDIVSSTMVLPTRRDVALTLRSQDVIHSVFIPAMRFKQDAVPGMEIHAHFKPMQLGTYEMVCTQLCGLGHYRMRATVRVVDEPEFERWMREREREK